MLKWTFALATSAPKCKLKKCDYTCCGYNAPLILAITGVSRAVAPAIAKYIKVVGKHTNMPCYKYSSGLAYAKYWCFIPTGLCMESFSNLRTPFPRGIRVPKQRVYQHVNIDKVNALCRKEGVI